MQDDPIKLYLVDDHTIFVEGVANLLGNVPGIQVAGWGNSAEEALAWLQLHEADVLVTDIEMPATSGIELTRIVKEKYPATKVIALSMFDKKEIVRELLSTGAEGYLLKDIEKKELVEAITEVHAGAYYYSSSIASVLMKTVVAKDLLTAREKEIIRLIASEKSNKEIAGTLFISEHTVEAHRKNIFRKTEAKSIVGLIKYAYENKLL
ncbi:MAG: response regulator transcription factor [Bacteroidetes bacterium]|nr:response regulator transcription factor [Bacteroidota bacterium]